MESYEQNKKKTQNKKEGGDPRLLKYAEPNGQHLPTSEMNFRGGTKAKKLAELSGEREVTSAPVSNRTPVSPTQDLNNIQFATALKLCELYVDL